MACSIVNEYGKGLSEIELIEIPINHHLINRMKTRISLVVFLLLTLSLTTVFSFHLQLSPADSAQRKEVRDWVISVLPPDYQRNGTVNIVDKTFVDWVNRTGELPEDFDALPSIPTLPNPLMLDEGGENIPIETPAQWQQKREKLKADLQHYITGSIPPPPDRLNVKVLAEEKVGEATRRIIELTFGPENKAKLTVEMMIPPGDGPFPVFLTQWNHREWAQIALRRGYIGCVYAAADSRDDSEEYAKIWWPDYDFSRLGRRAYATSRAIDYLYTLPYVDKEKIGLTGHSRNGKLSLMAAAFDERIGAIITSSAGTGGEVPWRYCSHFYDVEDLALLTCAQPTWFHPRLRYFVGREHKLPIDQNSFMALVAPRGLMLSTAMNESASNTWGMEQAYHMTLPVYAFLGREDHFTMRVRHGKHSVSARDLEDYIDFFDYVFGRSKYKPPYRFYHPYTFEKWKNKSLEKVDVTQFPKVEPVDKMGSQPIRTIADWEKKKVNTLERLNWLLGTKPPGVANPGPKTLANKGVGEDGFGTFITRPSQTARMKVMPVSPYNGFGDNLFGYLYYPANEKGLPINENLPVVVYLHEFDYSKGFGSMGWDHQIQPFFEKLTALGYAVFSFDMMGFGNRLEEGTRFYDRYPQWSKLGKMVTDVQAAVLALENMEFVNPKKIYLAGYSLGAKVGLMTAALDNRVAGVVSVAGFTPWRTAANYKEIEGLGVYSHLHGLIPKLGYFKDYENRIPCDYDELIASVAPRPVFVIAPELDRNHPIDAVKSTLNNAAKIYRLYQAPQNLSSYFPKDHNRFSDEMKEQVYDWFEKMNKP